MVINKEGIIYYKEPPKDEFSNRCGIAKKQLELNDLDLLFIYSDDRMMHGPGNVRYFSDFPAHFEDVAIIISKVLEPILVTGPECKEYANLVSTIKDVRVIEEFAMPDEDYPFTEMTGISRIVKEIEKAGGEKIRRLGIAGLNIIPFITYTRITEAMGPDIEIVDSDEIIYHIRSQKSDWEKQLMSRGYDLAGSALDEALKILKPGITEIEIAATIEKTQRENGAECAAVDTIVSFGRDNTYPIVNRPGSNRLNKDDFGILTFGPRIHGYNAAIGRPFFIGKPQKAIVEAVKTALEAQIACQQALKPGVQGYEVEAIGRKVLKKAGLEKYFVYSGIHSIGVAEFEPPIFGPKSRDIVKADMVLSIDIPIFLTPWGGIRFEDGFLITENGSKILSDYHREIIYL